MERRPSSQDPQAAKTVSQDTERESSRTEDRWLDLIADLIVEDLLNEERA
jgi:hypothetical protein